LDTGSSALDGGSLNSDTSTVLSDTGLFADAQSDVADATTSDTGVHADAMPADAMLADAGFPPDSGPSPQFLDLVSSYQTHYLLDLSAYLGGIGNLAGPLDTIDQALGGNINTGVTLLDSLIASAIAQFIPPWVVTVVDILNDVANFFNEVESDGVMTIAQELPQGTTAVLHATEVWNVLTVRIIDGCPLGRMDPNYPACARQAIPIAMPGMVGPLEVGVDVKPFDGVLQAGTPAAPFQFDDREVDMELTKLVRIILDIAIRVGTNGQVQSLQDALNRAIDCAQLEMEALNLATPILGSTLGGIAAANVRTACDREKQNVLNAIIGAIEGIGIGWEVMQFDQIGYAVDTNGNNRPETLQVLTTPDTINGRFRAIVSDPMSGSWEGINLNP